MKKLIALLLCAAVLLPVLPVLAEEPAVSLHKTVSEINGGVLLPLTLTATAPFAEDTPVNIACQESSRIWTVLFPAGETSASVEIETDRVSSRTAMHYFVASGAGYTAAGSRVTIETYTLPRVEFYLDENIGFVGHEMSVSVTCRNPASILDNTGFQLRDQTGYLYQEKKWADPEGWLTFRFDVIDEMEGGKFFSVWWNGIRLTEIGTGYGAITNARRPIIRTVETDEPYMAITIDCCYYDNATDKILDVLDEFGVKCTFFMAGYFIREYPESAKKILARGHEIGNHSSTHPHMLELESTYLQKRQLQKPMEEIEAVLGVRTRLYRPPYGEHDQTITAMARGEGMEVVMWTTDSHDWDDAFRHDPEGVIARDKKDAGPGCIILHHLDGFNTTQILREVIPYFQNELGLTLVPVTELMAKGGRYVPDIPIPDTLTELPEELR